MPCITKHQPRWKYSCSHLTIPFIMPISLPPIRFSLSSANATPVIWNFFFNPPTVPTSSSLPTRSNTTPQPSTATLQTYISPLPGKKAPPTPTTNITTTIYNNIFRAPARSHSCTPPAFAIGSSGGAFMRRAPGCPLEFGSGKPVFVRLAAGSPQCFGASSQAQWLSKG